MLEGKPSLKILILRYFFHRTSRLFGLIRPTAPAGQFANCILSVKVEITDLGKVMVFEAHPIDQGQNDIRDRRVEAPDTC